MVGEDTERGSRASGEAEEERLRASRDSRAAVPVAGGGLGTNSNPAGNPAAAGDRAPSSHQFLLSPKSMTTPPLVKVVVVEPFGG